MDLHHMVYEPLSTPATADFKHSPDQHTLAIAGMYRHAPGEMVTAMPALGNLGIQGSRHALNAKENANIANSNPGEGLKGLECLH